MSELHNPWRQFIENCISGDNYFRASEYRQLLDQIDGWISEAATLRAQVAALKADVLSARADGRSEAVAMLLQMSAENALEDCISGSQDQSGEWYASWKDEELHAKFRTSDKAWSLILDAWADDADRGFRLLELQEKVAELTAERDAALAQVTELTKSLSYYRAGLRQEIPEYFPEMRELLELAALALGLTVIHPEETKRGECIALRCSDQLTKDPASQFEYHWRPHTDDGDSRRLQVALGIECGPSLVSKTPEWWAYQSGVIGKGDVTEELVEVTNGDSPAAARLAVLKVAAEIGRRMKKGNGDA